MTTREDLLVNWNQQLVLAEEAELATATWRQRVRTRLYRFLLAMYGGATWTGSPGDADEVSKHPAALLVSEDAELPDAADIDELNPAGKAPRTRAEILRGLKNVRGLSEELAPPGPLQKGLPPDAPMAVAAYRKQDRAEALVRELKRAGFLPKMVLRGNLFQVFVSAADAPQAVELMASWADGGPSPAARRLRAVRGRSGTSPLLIAALVFGAPGILLTMYCIPLIFSLNHATNSTLAQMMEQLPFIAPAAIALDTLCAWFLWTEWKWQILRARQNAVTLDSPAK